MNRPVNIIHRLLVPVMGGLFFCHIAYAEIAARSYVDEVTALKLNSLGLNQTQRVYSTDGAGNFAANPWEISGTAYSFAVRDHAGYLHVNATLPDYNLGDPAYDGSITAPRQYVDTKLAGKLDINSTATGRARAYTIKTDGTQETRGIFGQGHLMTYGPAGGGDYHNTSPTVILTFQSNSAEAGLSYTTIPELKTVLGMVKNITGTEQPTGRYINGNPIYTRSFTSAQTSMPGAVLIKKAEEWSDTVDGATTLWIYEYTKN